MTILQIIKKLTIIMLVNSISVITYADNCSCIWKGSFVNIIDKADLIISGQVINSKGNSIDVNIEQILIDRATNGKEFNSDIRIWGDNGSLCRPVVEEFPINSHWVMALNKITKIEPNGFNPNTPNISFGRINDYYLSKCGANWLELHDGYATGNLINGKRWVWNNDKMNPVLLELIEAFIRGVIPTQALVEAAKPQTEAQKLMDQTKNFILTQ